MLGRLRCCRGLVVGSRRGLEERLDLAADAKGQHRGAAAAWADGREERGQRGALARGGVVGRGALGLEFVSEPLEGRRRALVVAHGHGQVGCVARQRLVRGVREAARGGGVEC